MIILSEFFFFLMIDTNSATILLKKTLVSHKKAVLHRRFSKNMKSFKVGEIVKVCSEIQRFKKCGL